MLLLKIRKYTQVIPTHGLVPAGPIPTAFDPDGYYPYPSFSATSPKAEPRKYQMLSLENDLLKVVLCPDLGGRVQSLFHKPSGKESLFLPKTIRPTRILPRMAFLSGGIETSFPISHSPVQIETLAWRTATEGGRIYAWCGEREVHAGMHWTVEFSLGPGEAFLSQRTLFHNPGKKSQTWMSWSNAAVAARPDTMLDFPGGPVLVHNDKLATIDWKRQGPERQKDIRRMTGYFWKKPDVNAFGAYTPSLGVGLYHVADPRHCPGIKLWSYGQGKDRAWAKEAGGDYLEIQAGPLKDQSRKGTLKPGQTRVHREFWIPSGRRLNIRELKLPSPPLIAESRIPRFGWVRKPVTQPPALKKLQASKNEKFLALAGRILRQKKRFEASLACFEKMMSGELTLHPQVVVERDMTLQAMGPKALAARRYWLEEADWKSDQRLIERWALWLADSGRNAESEKLLAGTKFQKIHQRYFRSELWIRVRMAQEKNSANPPSSLGEDDLAKFGAYRDHDKD